MFFKVATALCDFLFLTEVFKLVFSFYGHVSQRPAGVLLRFTYRSISLGGCGNGIVGPEVLNDPP